MTKKTIDTILTKKKLINKVKTVYIRQPIIMGEK